MSLAKPQTIDCPHCSKSQEVQIYTSVNVTVDPDLKAKVMNRTLNSFTCAGCKKHTGIVSGFLYHDMEKKIMMNLKVSEDPTNFNQSEFSNELKSNGYILRDVFSTEEMIEKIKIFDLSLNDKVLSGIKDIFFDSFKEVIGDDHLYVFFKEYKKGFFSKKLSFIMFTHPEQLLAANYDVKNLDKQGKESLFNLDALRGEDWISVV